MADKEYELLVPMSVDSRTHHKKGDPVTLSEERAAELIAAGAIKDPSAKDEEPGGQTVAPKGDGDGSDEGTEPEPTTSTEPPARGAAKAKWVEYATSELRGEDTLSKEDAEVLTRDQLAEKYLGPDES